jgi:hypothetical protein
MKVCAAVLVLAAWLSQAAWAQPAERTAYVDSREECTALGGAWLDKRGTWQANCQTPWRRDECLRLGGAWSPLVGAPANGVCLAQVSPAATARQCADSGGSWGPPGSAMPFCQPGRAVARVTAASDANKVCDGQSDCLYGCVYTGPPKPTGTQVTGHCRPTSKVEGCYSMVDKGRLAGNICMK